MGLFIQSAIALSISVMAMAAIVKLGVFNRIHLELGYEHYAEKTLDKAKVKMPFNAAVNVGYVLVGFYWIWRARNLKLSRVDLFYLDVFSIIGIIYGPVQFARIVTQQHLFAVLDQWIILPFFAWVYIWGYHLLDDVMLTRPKLLLIMLCSVASYCMTLVNSQGYSYALYLHIFCAVATAVCLQRQHGNRLTLLLILYGALFCFGYIGFKFIDHHLLNVHWVFSRVSGHFLSRVCDVLKIHVAALYFVENVRIAHKHN